MEYIRYPQSKLETSDILSVTSSEYIFSGKQGKLDLRLTVRDSRGQIIENVKFEQVDSKDRKYSATRNNR